jgi:hypothetical protein
MSLYSNICFRYCHLREVSGIGTNAIAAIRSHAVPAPVEDIQVSLGNHFFTSTHQQMKSTL